MNIYVSRCYWAKNFGIHILRPPIKNQRSDKKHATKNRANARYNGRKDCQIDCHNLIIDARKNVRIDAK